MTMNAQAPVSHPAEKTEIVVFKAARLPYHDAINERFGIDKSAWKALVEAIYPGAKTIDSVVMALSYCKARNLDPFKRPVHIVPMWDSKGGSDGKGGYVETVWPGITEIRTTAFRTKQYAGCDEAEFGPVIKRTFKGKTKKWVDKRETYVETTIDVEYPEWCRMTVYRELAGRVCKFVGPKVKWIESYATIGKTELPNDMWESRPEGQLEKCAEAAALRKAFPEEIGNELTAEEMAGRQINEAREMREIIPRDEPPAPPPPEPATVAAPKIIEPHPEKLDAIEEIVGRMPEKVEAHDDGMPDPSGDPEAFLSWIDKRLGAIPQDMGEMIGTIWEEQIEPRLAGMFPPDQSVAEGLYRKHCKRLSVG